MAFGLQYFSRLENTQSYDPTYNGATGLVLNPCINVWTYNAQATGSNDAEAAASAVGYFNGASGYLKVGDFILITTNDPANHIYNVTVNAAGVVTVAVTV